MNIETVAQKRGNAAFRQINVTNTIIAPNVHYR